MIRFNCNDCARLVRARTYPDNYNEDDRTGTCNWHNRPSGMSHGAFVRQNRGQRARTVQPKREKAPVSVQPPKKQRDRRTA